VLHSHTDKPLERALFARYFEKLYHACDLDAQGIAELLKVDGQTLAVNFRTAAEKFRLIQDEDNAPVIVHFRGLDGNDSKVDELLNTLRKHGPERWLMRKLQRYTVTVHRREVMELLSQGDVEEAIPGLYVQVSDWLYDEKLGFSLDGRPLGSYVCVV
jgi:CRISPR-associated endonuclease/helicase Cas3